MSKKKKKPSKDDTTPASPPTLAAASPPAEIMNPEIRELHQSLIQRHQTLSGLLDQATSADAAQAILNEMREVSNRITAVGALLFNQTTAKIDQGIVTVLEASADLDNALKQAADVDSLIKSTTKFLGQVDKILGMIKLL
jgi:uncharacterized protein with gpF-like domain